MTGAEQIPRDKTTPHQRRREGKKKKKWRRRATRPRCDCCSRPAAQQDQSSKCQASQDHPGKPARPLWDLRGSRSQVTAPRTRRTQTQKTQSVRKAHKSSNAPLICPSCSDLLFSPPQPDAQTSFKSEFPPTPLPQSDGTRLRQGESRLGGGEGGWRT